MHCVGGGGGEGTSKGTTLEYCTFSYTNIRFNNEICSYVFDLGVESILYIYCRDSLKLNYYLEDRSVYPHFFCSAKVHQSFPAEIRMCDLPCGFISINPFICIKNNRRDISSKGYADL